LLAEEHGCANCHRPAAGDRMGAGLVQRPGPVLTKVGGRVSADWLDRWLPRPEKPRPPTTRPHPFANDPPGPAERYAVGRYLTLLGGPLPPARPTRDAKELVASRARGQALFTTAGCVACHRDAPGKPAPAPLYGTPSNYPLGDLGAKTTPE